MMAQNCLIPKGPPKLETVNVPPCEEKNPACIYPYTLDDHHTINYYLQHKSIIYLIIFWF